MKNPPAKLDQAEYMHRSLQLARKGLGLVEPNPMVGCVIVKGGRVVGEGYHRRFGGDHAELAALKQAGPRAYSSTVFVILEPCDYQGKTPPCTEILIHAKVRRVVIAMRDPNPLVMGRGVRKLRKAGIQVSVGLLADEARNLNAAYLKRHQQGLPYVIAKWAQSLDGKIATRSGDSKWISSASSRKLVHQLRGRVDAILVGSGTILQDDPLLTCREVVARRRAARVILDTRLRTPPHSQVVQTARKFQTIIFTSRACLAGRNARKLNAAGAIVKAVPLKNGNVSLQAVLRRLAKEEMTNVLLEGGSRIIGSAFDLGLVDEAYVFVASMIIGGAGASSAVTGRGPAAIKQARNLKGLKIRRIGPDILFHFKT